MTPEQLESSIPSSESPSPTEESALHRIKRLVEEMNQHLRLRKEVAEQAKRVANADDISPALLKKTAEWTSSVKKGIHHQKIEVAQFEDMFIEELRKYDTFLMTVDQEDERQSVVLKQLNEAYQQYKYKLAHPEEQGELTKREKALQNLNQAYLKYKEIKTNLSEGLKVKERQMKKGEYLTAVCSFIKIIQKV